MDLDDLLAGLRPDTGREIHALIARLYPICRSITGDGVRRTLAILRERIPLEIHEVRSGTAVFDWTVPREWNIRDAYIKNSRGERVVDFRKCNLHVLNYSVPVKARMGLAELRPHLFSLPDHPDWIPYRTSYYRENWGFCLTHHQLEAMEDGDYEVCIDSSLEDGHLTYGECFLPGESEDEALLSTHVCHPSLANDNLSGVAIASFLVEALGKVSSRRFSYRFLFIPGTIGSITWLARNQARTSRIRHGLTLACLGDPGRPTYKKSRRGNAEIDRAAALVLKQTGRDFEILEFSPQGYDERQFCSPAFNLPLGCLMRTPHGRFPQYHTSADDLDLVREEALADSLWLCLQLLGVLERNRTYLNLNPACEPQLGKRGLYREMGGKVDASQHELALLWVLNQSDGTRSLLDIAERSGQSFHLLHEAAERLERHGLLRRTS